MAVEILYSVLAFPIDGFVQVFDDFGASSFRPREVGIYVGHEDGQALRCRAELCRASSAWTSARQHEIDIAKAHLGAAGLGRIAVAVVLGESEDSGEPIDCRNNITIGDVGQDGVDGNGAIGGHGEMVSRTSGAKAPEILGCG